LFGAKWLPSVEYLQVLCVGGLFWPLHVVNLNALLAQGYSRLFFRLEVTKRTIGILALILASFYGLKAIVWSQAAVAAISFLLNAHYTKSLLGYGAASQARDLVPLTVVAVTMGFVVVTVSESTHLTPSADLGLLVPLGAGVYLAGCRCLRIRAFPGVWRLARNSLRFGQSTE
jgi:O-antigen/teichoic acid export membrane protein